MIHRRTLTITLLTPAAFTEDGATTGGATTLTRIPGGALLGAAAAQLAPSGGAARSRDFERAFVLGHVRFSDGLPMNADEVGLPMPLSLHTVKGDTSGMSINLARAPRQPGTQLEQARDGYLTQRGSRFEIKTQMSMRTAVAPDGRARDRHLYTLKTVPSGTVYQADIASEDADLLDRVCNALCGDRRLGRSRTAEFGLAKIVCAPARDVPAPTDHDAVVLLCLSDLALRHPHTGAPTYELSPSALGLPAGASIVTERSFVRTRRYSPFNGHRRRPELERHVIVAGSVIVVRLPAGTALPDLAERLWLGVGDNVASGLGRIAVNPTVLATDALQLREITKDDPHLAPLPSDDLGRWVAQREERARDGALLDTWITKAVEHLQRSSGRVPTSQWGQLRDLALRWVSEGVTASELQKKVELHLSTGMTKQIWHQARGADQKLVELLAAPKFGGVIDKAEALRLGAYLESGTNLAVALHRLASEITRSIKRKENP